MTNIPFSDKDTSSLVTEVVSPEIQAVLNNSTLIYMLSIQVPAYLIDIKRSGFPVDPKSIHNCIKVIIRNLKTNPISEEDIEDTASYITDVVLGTAIGMHIYLEITRKLTSIKYDLKKCGIEADCFHY